MEFDWIFGWKQTARKSPLETAAAYTAESAVRRTRREVSCM
jgi:hypothetical protein